MEDDLEAFIQSIADLDRPEMLRGGGAVEIGTKDDRGIVRSGSPGRIRTSDQPVNSRLLYH